MTAAGEPPAPLPPRDRGVPRDLKFIVLWLALVVLSVSLPPLDGSLVRIVLVLPFFLFIPGYLILAILFPDRSRIDPAERAGLSIAVSVAATFLVGYGLNLSPWGVSFLPVFLIILAGELILLVPAYLRRAALPPGMQFVMPFPLRVRRIPRVAAVEKDGRAGPLLAGLLALFIIAGCIAVAFVILFPAPGESFTEFYVLSGNRTLADFPAGILPGNVTPLYIGIGNREHRDINYTVEVYEVQAGYSPVLNATTVLGMDRLGGFPAAVPANGTVLLPWNLTVTRGYNRVDFLLFGGPAPADRVTGIDRINASYRHLFLWLNATPAG
ncbi:MAG TPA: DUF1616 domain-containing protein [Methanomicrobiales archaeon]|nr:DUF1616 domain-containing protein [Methanomicrobiales archaeon]